MSGNINEWLKITLLIPHLVLKAKGRQKTFFNLCSRNYQLIPKKMIHNFKVRPDTPFDSSFSRAGTY